jgi:hypothetical protein
MKVQASVLAFVAMAASTSAFAPSSGTTTVRKVALKGVVVDEHIDLVNIEAGVSSVLYVFGRLHAIAGP